MNELFRLDLGIVGDPETGKRSLVRRLLEGNSFRETPPQPPPSYESHPSPDLSIYHCLTNSVSVDIYLDIVVCDTEDAARQQLGNATTVIICYSDDVPHSQERVSYWTQVIESIRARPNIKVAKTKCDRTIVIEDHGLYLTSAHTLHGLVSLFHTAMTEALWRTSQHYCNLLSKKQSLPTPLREHHSQRATLIGVWDLTLRCSVCTFGIPENAEYERCFADECHEGWITCTKCVDQAAPMRHQHATYRTSNVRGLRHIRGEKLRNTVENLYRYLAPRPALGWRVADRPRHSHHGHQEHRHDASDEWHHSTGSQTCGAFRVTHHGQFAWMTFGQLLDSASRLRDVLLRMVRPRQLVGLCSENRYEWFVADTACQISDIVAIPLFTTMDLEATSHILDDARLCGVISDQNCLMLLAQAAVQSQHRTTEFIISMDDLDDATESEFRSRYPTLQLYKLSALLDPNSEQTLVASLSLVRTLEHADDDVLVIEYTSGSTGRPKGVVVTDHAWNHSIKIDLEFKPWIMMGYQPLAHSSHANSIAHFASGGSIVLYPHEFGNQLFIDMQVVNPSEFDGTPRIFSTMYSQHKVALECEWNVEQQKPPPHRSRDAIQQEIMDRFQGLLGNRVKSIVVGSAPCSEEVQEWMRKCFKCRVTDAYGTTEAGAISNNGLISLSKVDVKLVDVPELGYLQSDLPFPRGEILVKSAEMASRYHRDPDLTAKTWTEDGYVRTGDIGQLEAGTLRIIGRIKHTFKLAQGEFVCPDRLQEIFLQSALVDQIYIHADSTKSFLVAVVVPLDEAIELRMAERAGDSAAFTREQLVLQELETIAKQQQLAVYEIVRGVYFAVEPFSVQNGQMTPSNKINRRAIEKRYKEQLGDLYEQVEAIDVRSHICSMIDSVLGRTAEGQPFASVGGDSVTAVNLALLIQKQFHVSVPVHSLLTADASTVASLVNNARRTSKLDLSSSLSLSASAHELDNDLMALDMHLDDTIQFQSPIESLASEPRSVFITGATGFIGSHLVRHLVATLAPDTKIACLVRASSSRNQESLRALADDPRLEIVDGDLGEIRFGLSQQEFEQLANRFDCIYHVGAYVNHFLPYSAARSVNVEGTRQILQLLAIGRPKLLHYISTISVLSEYTKERYAPEELEFEEGYISSKAIAEMLVSQAISRGAVAAIYRPGQISANIQTGFCDPTHFIHRLLIAIVLLGAYPSCSSLVEMTPVNWCVETIVACSLDERSRGQAFNISNHAAFLPLSDVVAAIQSFGYDLEGLVFKKWKEILHEQALAAADDERKRRWLAPLVLYFEDITQLEDDTKFPTSNVTEIIGEATPVNTLEYIYTILRFFVDTQVLPPPLQRK